MQPLMISATERFDYYDRQRRLRLIRLLAPAQLISAVISVPLFIGIEVRHSIPFLTPPIANAILAGIILLSLSYLLGFLLARRGAATAAAIVLLSATMLIILGTQAAYIYGSQFDQQAWQLFMADGLVLVLAAAIGKRWMVLVCTAIFIAYLLITIVTYYYSTGTDTTTHHELFGLLGSGPFILITTAALVIFMQNGFYQMARDTGDLALAVEQARQLDDLKDQFITSVNHELRNPVMVMVSNLDLMNFLVKKVEQPALKQALDRAIQAGWSLRTLIGSILAVNQIEAETQAPHLAAVSVRNVLTTAIAAVDPIEARIEQRDLRLSIPEHLQVWADPVQLQQILTNLLSNATKYSAPGSPVAVTATVSTATSHRQPVAEIHVRDWGHGIPVEQVPLLFNRFVRLPRDLASTTVGNGLGLYLCKKLVEGMQGKIWVESAGIEGEGSRFIVQLPLPTAAPVGQR